MYFITISSRGLNTKILKELYDEFVIFRHCVIHEEDLDIFKNKFDTKIKNYNGRARPPIYRFLDGLEAKYFTMETNENSSIILCLTRIDGTIQSNATVETKRQI
ncbi:MAG: hypothetical protein LBF71_02015 [Campylobacteraceae bacterium]|jgi:hypothetical protein|nr:hypothetical protein [Campylobacteraceae bacterium]